VWGNRVEQNHYIFSVLDQPLSPFPNTISATCAWRSGGSSNVELMISAWTVALEIGDLFRPFVDQQHNHHCLGLFVVIAFAIFLQ